MSDVEEPEPSSDFKEKLLAFSFHPSSPRRSPRKRKARLETPPARQAPPKTRRSPLKRGFAPPEKYSHLRPLQDYFAPHLDIVFCGINPGQKSAEIGHHFGGPTNHFWPCLHESGLTTERLPPTQDFTLPDRFSIGMTNLVDRPTAEQNELSRKEQLASVPSLLDKIARYKPRVVCFVGLGITQLVKSQALPRTSKPVKGEEVAGFGLQPYKMCHNDSGAETLFFAVASTSGRVVQYQKTHKIEQFKGLKMLLDKIKCGDVDTSALHRIQKSGSAQSSVSS